MTGKAGGQIPVFAVEGPAVRAKVARRAFWHDLIVVLFSRIVHVVLPVAAYTLNPVFGPGLFDGLKNREMTLTALRDCQRLYLDFIDSCGLCTDNLFCRLCRSRSFSNLFCRSRHLRLSLYASINCNQADHANNTKDYSHLF